MKPGDCLIVGIEFSYFSARATDKQLAGCQPHPKLVGIFIIIFILLLSKQLKSINQNMELSEAAKNILRME